MITSIHDNSGAELDSTVTLEQRGDVCNITFESQGPNRNTDYGKAFRLVIERLGAAGATILGAEICSRDVQDLPPEARSLVPADVSFPFRCTPETNMANVASDLARASAAVARQPGARGPGNRTRRLRLAIKLPVDGATTVDRVLDFVIAPEVGSSEEASGTIRRRGARSGGQGFGLPSEAKRAVELRAMQVAREFLAQSWDSVEDVSAPPSSYDILCRSGERRLIVEVKGTTSIGTSVMLTANEVAIAQRHFPHTALCVVESIVLSVSDSQWIASGGLLRVINPWDPTAHTLVAERYRCVLGGDRESR